MEETSATHGSNLPTINQVLEICDKRMHRRQLQPHLVRIPPAHSHSFHRHLERPLGEHQDILLEPCVVCCVSVYCWGISPCGRVCGPFDGDMEDALDTLLVIGALVHVHFGRLFLPLLAAAVAAASHEECPNVR